LILEDHGDGTLTVLRFSAHMDLYDPLQHLKFSSAEPDFPASGLSKDCFLSDELIEVKVEHLNRHIGKLEGELLKKVNDWIGPIR
jgi:hypothetical protein